MNDTDYEGTATMTAALTQDRRREIVDTIYRQIAVMTFATLGASDIRGMNRREKAGLAFSARIIPFLKSGKRGSAPRKMLVIISLNASDLYDIEVIYGKYFEKSHVTLTDISVEALNRTLTALDYDGDEALNPREV